jgi:hypothetical protein
MEYCKGCSTKEICYAYGTENEAKICPCAICIVKTMCNLSCNAYDRWLKKFRDNHPWKR